eukprot:4205881-Amphidinium_carterae.1
MDEAVAVEEAADAPVHLKRGPRDPTHDEVERHVAAGHIPHRSWRRSCIAGRGRQDQHRASVGEHAIPTVGLDY